MGRREATEYERVAALMGRTVIGVEFSPEAENYVTITFDDETTLYGDAPAVYIDAPEPGEYGYEEPALHENE